MIGRTKWFILTGLAIATIIAALALTACSSINNNEQATTDDPEMIEDDKGVDEDMSNQKAYESVMNAFKLLEEELYTPATYRLTTIAQEKLVSLLDDSSSDQDMLDQAADDLQRAIAALRTKNGSTSLAKTYEDYFDLGTIYGGASNFETNNSRGELTRTHFNALTAENSMKPDQLSSGLAGTDGSFNIGESLNHTADDLARLALEHGYTVHGHVLVWHSQSPDWVNGGLGGDYTREQARTNMERYIKTVVEHFDTHYPGVVTSWDVVNEALVDGVSTASDSTDWKNFLRGSDQSAWYKAYSNGMTDDEDPSDYIYDAFVFARQYTNAKLFYNDFNMYQDGKSKLAANMVIELNERYRNDYPDDARQLIEGVGMQSHNYIIDTPPASVEKGIQNLLAADIDLIISELDLFCWFPWNAEPTSYMDLRDRGVDQIIGSQGSSAQKNYWINRGITNGSEIEVVQAEVFAEYFKIYMAYHEHIDRVTFWGLNDQQSWRSGHNPLLWNSDWSPKDAFYAVSDPDGYLNGAP